MFDLNQLYILLTSTRHQCSMYHNTWNFHKSFFQLSLHRIWQVLAGVSAKGHHGVQQNQRLVWKHCPDKVGRQHDLFQSEYWSWHSLSSSAIFQSENETSHKKLKCVIAKTLILYFEIVHCDKSWQVVKRTCQSTIMWSVNIILGYTWRGQMSLSGVQGTLSYLI